MIHNGWIKLHRKITDNGFYFSEAFSRGQAWIDLLLLANHTKNFFFKRGIKVEVLKGQTGYDVETLSQRWMWSRSKTERFLMALETEQQIVRQKSNVTTLISIVNYELYQAEDNPNDKANGNPNDKANSNPNDKTNSNPNDKANSNPNDKANEKQTIKQTNTNKNDKELKNDKEVLKESEKFNFSQSLINLNFDIQLVKDWMLIRKAKKAQNSETAFNLFMHQVKLSKLKNEVLEICITNNWSGFRAEWLNNKKFNKNESNTNSKISKSNINSQFKRPSQPDYV